MGLLDYFTNMDPDQSQGLLAAASQMLQASGPSRTPTSFGQVLGGGMGAYQQSMVQQQLLRQKMQESQQEQALRALQIKGAEGELDDKTQARKDSLDARNFYLKFNQPGQADQPSQTDIARSILGNNMSPTVANADKLSAAQPAAAPTAPAQQPDLYSQRIAQAQAMRRSGNPALIQAADALEKNALAFRPKYSTDFRVAQASDGQLHNYLVAEDGTLKDAGAGVRPDMTSVDLGGTTQFVDKNAVKPGTSFTKTATVGERLNANQAAARLAFDRSQADSTQDAAMDPLAVHMVAQQYLAGDTSALQNFGRGAQGAQNLNAVRAEIAKQATSQGLNGSDIAARIAEFGGVKAGQRTAATRSAGIEIAANEVSQLAPLALDASSKVARSGFLPFGKAQVMFDSNTNDPNLRQFAMANTALTNAYGQAMARGGVASVADKEHAKELLGTAMDQPSYAAAVAQLQKEIQAAQAAPKAVRKELSSGLTGRGRESAPAASGGWSIQRVSP